MFDLIIAIIFGFVQGITEFLPVSSSGHLLVLHEFFDLPVNSELAFDVTLHLATFLAVLSFFYKDVIAILTSWLKSFASGQNAGSRLGWKIILATLPAVFFGYFFEDIIENQLRSVYVVIFMLVFLAILFLLIEKISKQNKDVNEISKTNSLLIGFAQALALIPGTSRSGATIIAGLMSGLKREAAVRFSFLMSLPIVFGASIKKIPHFFEGNPNSFEIMLLSAAFLSAFFSGYFTIKYFLRYVKNHSLAVFAWYRIALALILLFVFKFF